MKQDAGFSVSAILLGILTAVLADMDAPGGSIRAVILYSFVNAGCLTVLILLAGIFWRSAEKRHRTAALVLAVWLLIELAQTILQAQNIAQQEFRSMALIGILPFLLWAGWSIAPGSWNASARVLWWFAALGGAVCLLGLFGQLSWLRLVEADTLLSVQKPTAVFYAEYLLWPLLCPGASLRKAASLPWTACVVQVAAAMGMGLVFGTSGYPALELLRAWSVGAFSRMDALLLLIWLACAIYRICILCAALHICWNKVIGEERRLPE